MNAGRCVGCGASEFTRVGYREALPLERCANCAIERLHPQPSDAALREIYTSSYYEAWGARHDMSVSREVKCATFDRMLEEIVPQGHGKLLLDCGAAFGFMLDVARARGITGYAAELEPEAGEILRRNHGAERVFVGPFEDAHFAGVKEGTFDVVTMCDFIEHVRDPEAVLRKAAALLRREGVLIINTPDVTGLSRRVLRARWPHYKLEHLTYFSRKGVRLLLERVGFSVQEIRGTRKVLSPAYLQHQFARYGESWYEHAYVRLATVLPERVRRAKVMLATGEMLVVARRHGAGELMMAE